MGAGGAVRGSDKYLRYQGSLHGIEVWAVAREKQSWVCRWRRWEGASQQEDSTSKLVYLGPFGSRGRQTPSIWGHSSKWTTASRKMHLTPFYSCACLMYKQCFTCSEHPGSAGWLGRVRVCFSELRKQEQLGGNDVVTSATQKTDFLSTVCPGRDWGTETGKAVRG